MEFWEQFDFVLDAELKGFWVQSNFVLTIGTELKGFWVQFYFSLSTGLIGFWMHFQFCSKGKTDWVIERNLILLKELN